VVAGVCDCYGDGGGGGELSHAARSPTKTRTKTARNEFMP